MYAASVFDATASMTFPAITSQNYKDGTSVKEDGLYAASFVGATGLVLVTATPPIFFALLLLFRLYRCMWR